MYLYFFNWSVSSVLACSWFTVLWWFQVDSRGTQPFIRRCAPSPPASPPIQAATSHRAKFPVLYSGALLAIRFKYSSVSYCEPLTEGFSLCWVQANSVKKKKKVSSSKAERKPGCPMLTERECAALSWVGSGQFQPMCHFCLRCSMLEITLL